MIKSADLSVVGAGEINERINKGVGKNRNRWRTGGG